jgi:hypothetical protein
MNYLQGQEFVDSSNAAIDQGLNDSVDMDLDCSEDEVHNDLMLAALLTTSLSMQSITPLLL